MFPQVLISFACTQNKSWSCWKKKIFLQMQKLFSKLSKTFEKWINFSPWNVKVFKSIFFFLLPFLILRSLTQKFFLAKNCFMEFFLIETCPVPRCPPYLHFIAAFCRFFLLRDFFFTNADEISRFNSSNSFIDGKLLEKPQFMEHITEKFKIL